MGPELIVLGILGAALILYALLGGADFGAGIWEFNTAFQPGDDERELIQRAVGPVWEANHVWLLFALVLGHTAFPLAYQAAAQALWLPLLLALAGIVFRGVGFVFRAYAVDSPFLRSVWGAVFALASTAAPFFFGAALGAVASGELAFTEAGAYAGSYLTGWIQPLGIFTAFFAVGVCSYLAAVYFTREAANLGNEALVATWRRRALATGAWMGILAAVGLVFLALEAPELWSGLAAGWLLIAASAVSGGASLWALARSRFTAASLAAAGAVVAVMAGWMLAQYPYLLPPAIEVETAKGPEPVLWGAVIAASLGAALLLPALALLFRLFKAPPGVD
ncbi:MAG: cytochrome d ubiquinol oxidase subunit II [Planctomycetota bacterium]